MKIKNLFFSYSRADGADFALRLAVDLQKEGFNVWIDQQDIRAGSEWDLEIEKALETCDCLLFIESEKSVISTNVLDEVYYALEQDKRVIPLVLVDSKTPFRLKRLQHINFSSNYDKGLAQLLQELKADEQQPARQIASAIQAPAKHLREPVYKRMPVLLGSLALILLVVIGGYTYFSKAKGKAENDKEVQVTETDTLKSGNDTQATSLGKPNDTANAALEKKTLSREVPGKMLPAKERKPSGNKTPPPVSSRQVSTDPANDVPLLAENFAGTWKLSGVAAPARGYRGYLNIEEVGENRIKILSNFQFNFIKANDTAYFEVFNGFASCASCSLKTEMPITDNDVAFGGQIYKILRADVEGEGKAGDTVMTIGPNKSINAAVTLHLVNKNSALIKVSRSTAVPMSYGMVIPPFDYTFRFTRKDL